MPTVLSRSWGRYDGHLADLAKSGTFRFSGSKPKNTLLIALKSYYLQFDGYLIGLQLIRILLGRIHRSKIVIKLLDKH